MKRRRREVYPEKTEKKKMKRRGKLKAADNPFDKSKKSQNGISFGFICHSNLFFLHFLGPPDRLAKAPIFAKIEKRLQASRKVFI